MTLGERILKYRKKAGVSQEELADNLNVTRQSISLWETDQTVPSLDSLIAIADIFGVSMDELCGRITDKTNEQTEPKEISNQSEQEKPLEDEQKCFACAQTAVTPQLFKKAQKLSQGKLIAVYVIGLLLGIAMLVALSCSKDPSALSTLPVPIFIIVEFAAILIRLITYSKSQEKKFLQKQRNYVYRYLFYGDHMTVKGKSENTSTVFPVKYGEIKKTVRDNDFVYVFYENYILPIEKASISEHTDTVLDLLKTSNAKNDNDYGENKVSVRVALILTFILSLLSIFIALITVMISLVTSPLPDFGFSMVEHMWKFFLVIPIPLTSAILGIVFLRKKYKCKKNIIAGLIMCALLAIYGSFTFIFQNQIGHDFGYVNYIENVSGVDLPDSGYITYQLDENKMLTTAMIKFDNANKIANLVKTDERFRQNTNAIPSNLLPTYDVAATADYDYFLLYDQTCKTYNSATLGTHNYHNFIYIAYSVDKNVLYVVDFEK